MGTALSPCIMCDVCNKAKHIDIHLAVDAKGWKPSATDFMTSLRCVKVMDIISVLN